jgi:aminomethyltransferase
MVDFGGWEMPLHYGSQIEEHHSVRRDCGMFDVSHMGAVDIIGADAGVFLQRLLANDVARLTQAGKALYSAMLNQAGGVIDDLIAYFFDATHYRLVLNAATSEKDLGWMTARLAEWGMDLTIIPRRDLAMIAVQGPSAREKVWRSLPQSRAASNEIQPFFAVPVDDVLVARTGYTGEDGFEITLPAVRAPALWKALVEAGVRPCGLGARDTLRLEAGMNLYEQDMDETVSPLDAGMGWSVCMGGVRDFVGRAAVVENGQRSRFLGLVLLERGVLRAQQKVVTAHGTGIITSGTFSPTLQQAIALARLPMAVAVGDPVVVEIRGRRHPARVVKPPFVRHGIILV